MSPPLPLACATGPPVTDPALARTNRTIAKSLVTLDIKPWDDETDMAALEAAVRSIEKPGLLWGLSKLVPIGFGIKKLQMSVVVEDELVSVDELQEEIAEFDDYVQVRPGVPFLRFFFFSHRPPADSRPAPPSCSRRTLPPWPSSKRFVCCNLEVPPCC